jgi:hypothetical protein
LKRKEVENREVQGRGDGIENETIQRRNISEDRVSRGSIVSVVVYYIRRIERVR